MPYFKPRAGVALRTALGLAFASDTVSITINEIVDNAIMLMIPGAMNGGLTDFRFRGSLVFALSIAGVVAFPVVRCLSPEISVTLHKYHRDANGAHSGHH